MKDGAKKFRELLANGGLIVAPGVYDGYSARLVEKAGFEMAATTGAGISNSLLGIDDIGVMGLSENVDHCRMLARPLHSADRRRRHRLRQPDERLLHRAAFRGGGRRRHQYRGP